MKIKGSSKRRYGKYLFPLLTLMSFNLVNASIDQVSGKNLSTIVPMPEKNVQNFDNNAQNLDSKFNLNSYINNNDANVDPSRYAHGVSKYLDISKKNKTKIDNESLQSNSLKTYFGKVETNFGYISANDQDMKFNFSINENALRKSLNDTLSEIRTIGRTRRTNAVGVSLISNEEKLDLNYVDKVLKGIKFCVQDGWFFNAKILINLHSNISLVVGAGLDTFSINYDSVQILQKAIKEAGIKFNKENLINHIVKKDNITQAEAEKIASSAMSKLEISPEEMNGDPSLVALKSKFSMSNNLNTLENTFDLLEKEFNIGRKKPSLYKLNTMLGIRGHIEIAQMFRPFLEGGVLLHTYINPLNDINLGSINNNFKDHFGAYISAGADISIKDMFRVGISIKKEFYSLPGDITGGFKDSLKKIGYDNISFEAENMNPIKFGIVFGMDI